MWNLNWNRWGTRRCVCVCDGRVDELAVWLLKNATNRHEKWINRETHRKKSLYWFWMIANVKRKNEEEITTHQEAHENALSTRTWLYAMAKITYEDNVFTISEWEKHLSMCGDDESRALVTTLASGPTQATNKRETKTMSSRRRTRRRTRNEKWIEAK